MKILMVIDSLAKGGRERRLVSLVHKLQHEKKSSIFLVVLSQKIEYRDVLNSCEDLFVIHRKPKSDPRVFRKLLGIVGKVQPHVIHTWGSMSTIYAIPASKWQNIPLVNGSIADAPKMNLLNYIYRRTRLTFLFSDKVVANSKAGLQAYRAPANKSVCIYNGFDFNRTHTLVTREQIRSKYHLNSTPVVGMVAAFHQRKDYPTFIDAALILLEAKREVRFICIGDGPDRPAIQKMIPSEYQPYFTFTGNLTDVESIINLFDIGILTTNTEVHGEGISNSIMEYMALAKPVLATNCGGTPEIVVDQVTGYLINPNSPRELSFLIAKLLDEPLRAEEMGKAGQSRLKKHFSIEKMVDRYLGVYQSVMSEKSDQ